MNANLSKGRSSAAPKHFSAANLISVCFCLCLWVGGLSAENPGEEKEIARNIELLRKPNKNIDDGRYYSVREEAAVALGSIGPSATNAVPALIDALNDERPRVQWAAAAALGNIGPGAKAAVPVLIERIERLNITDDEEVKALGKIGFGAKTAIPAIIAYMRRIEVDVVKEENTGNARALYVHAASLIRIAEGIRANVDTESIPALESMVRVLEDCNFPPKVMRLVEKPLAFLKAEVAAGRGPPPAPDEIARCWNLVVQIEGKEADGKLVLGSGIIFGCKGDALYVATAKHVVRRELSQLGGLRVRTKSLLPGETLPAELKSLTTPELDLAVLVVRDIQKYGIPIEKIPFDRMGKPQSLGANEKVYALGLPITQAGEPLQSDEFVEATASKLIFRSAKTVREGYSGGALFNSNWQLVGMIRADDPPLANAIAIDQILAQIKEWGYPVNLKVHTP